MNDEQIAQLLSEPKVIVSKKRWATSAGHSRQDYVVRSKDGKNDYSLYLRQSTHLQGAFSCGLIWSPKSQDKLTLTRYNGYEHEHTNHIEGEKFTKQCHIHIATERYIEAGFKPDEYAQATDRFSTLDAALLCLLTDCNIEHHDDSNPTPDFLD